MANCFEGRCFSCKSLFPLRMCQFTPKRNSCTWKSGCCIDVSRIPYSWQHMSGLAFPTHQHRFLGARLCRHSATRVAQVFIIQTTVFLYSVFLEQRRSRGLCLVFWTCSATFSISDSSTSNLSLPDSPPSTILAPQL